MKYYKFLLDNGVSPYQYFQWPLPTKNEDGTWTPGAWTETTTGDLTKCANGWHSIREDQNLLAFAHATLYELEYDDDPTVDTDKCWGRSARLARQIETWNPRTQRLFACDCAEDVLQYWTAPFPDDNRPQKAIAAARALADNDTPETRAAAYAAAAAAYAAADAAAAAAYAAANAARAAAAAAYAAADAARAAARAAAYAAAADAAARAAARAAYTDTDAKYNGWLMEYIEGKRG